VTCSYPKVFFSNNPWNRLAEKSNKEILENLCVWGRDVQVKTRGDLLLPNCRKRITSWDIAALNGN